MRSLVFVVALLLSQSALAQSVKLPGEIRGAVGEWVIVTVKVDGGTPNWRVQAGLDEVPLGLLFPDEVLSQAKGKVFKGSKPGRFLIESWNAKDDVASDIAVCVVIIGDPPAPIPPGPQPPGPTPINPLAVKAVAGLTGFKAQAGQLAAFYETFKATIEKDTLIKTTGLFAKTHETALKNYVAAIDYKGAPKVGTLVDRFLGDAMGVTNADGTYSDVALTEAMRAKLAAALADLAVALRAVQ